jgi:hypothetical protein
MPRPGRHRIAAEGPFATAARQRAARGGKGRLLFCGCQPWGLEVEASMPISSQQLSVCAQKVRIVWRKNAVDNHHLSLAMATSDAGIQEDKSARWCRCRTTAIRSSIQRDLCLSDDVSEPALSPDKSGRNDASVWCKLPGHILAG